MNFVSNILPCLLGYRLDLSLFNRPLRLHLLKKRQVLFAWFAFGRAPPRFPTAVEFLAKSACRFTYTYGMFRNYDICRECIA